ncbi:MAG: pyrroline-5-carboxylate reductase [Lachnospiraceae bacterium]
MTELLYKFGFIGMGNMGFAILKGLLSSYDPAQLTFFEPGKEKAEDICARTGVTASADNKSCVVGSEYIVLAVKPQMYDKVIREIRDEITDQHIIISIAPGITIDDLMSRFAKTCRIVRAMPNTPALVGEGMTGICYDEDRFSQEEADTIQAFFCSFGKVERVDEKLMNAVVCASGSSPAYVYMFIEAMADSVVKYGLPRATAYEMVAQTVLGSARMVLETGEHPGRLKDQVCSPGGTTIAAVAALEEHGLRNALIKASDACYEKCTNIK